MTKTPQIVSTETTPELLAALSDVLCAEARRSVRERNAFHLALSGGTTPEPLYRAMAARSDFPWQKTQIFVVDERCVPEEDPRSNVRMLRAALVQTGAVPVDQLHGMNATAEHAASDYEQLLRKLLPDGRLDAVLLGMGSDGHTASLFPRSTALDETNRWVVSNDGPTVVPPARITLTVPFLNSSRWVGALVVGESKRAMLKNVFEGTIAPTDAPIRMIRPEQGLTYYIDRPADPRAF